MVTYKQIEPNFIQTHETHDDGSYTSGIIRRYETKTRAVDSEAKEIDAETEETYSPWDELDASLVEWLDVEAWQEEQGAETALQDFKNSRQALIDSAVVDANGFKFDADEVSIGRMASAVLAAIAEDDTFVIQWSLADTDTGVMTDITLQDLKLAHKLAVLNMAGVWGI
jgi:hypothetical protein